MHADCCARAVPTLSQKLRVDQHVNVTGLVAGEDLGQLTLWRLTGNGLGLDVEVAEGLGNVVSVANASRVDDARNAIEARLVEVGDRHVEGPLIEQLGEHLLIELDVNLAFAQRNVGNRAHAWAGRNPQAAER